MNNHSIRKGITVGDWISEEGLDVEKAFLWPYQPHIAENIKNSGEAGLSDSCRSICTS